MISYSIKSTHINASNSSKCFSLNSDFHLVSLWLYEQIKLTIILCCGE